MSLTAAMAALALALPSLASAHLERPSYWPDPEPDTAVSPPAGGAVPDARSLGSAVTGAGPGEVRVVCEGNSLQLATAAAGSGCGDAARGDDGPGLGVGQVRVGSVASLVQCRDWERGTRDERLATIHDIREQLHPSGNLEPQPDLSDDEAYALFQRSCSQPLASGFRLYKLYARAAAFSLLAPPGD